MRFIILILNFLVMTQNSLASLNCSQVLSDEQLNIKDSNKYEEIKKLIDFAESTGVWNSKKINRAQKDFEKALKLITKRKHHPAFKTLLSKWSTFFTKFESQILNLEKIKKDAKWTQSIEVFLSFSVDHFITFVESNDINVYQKQLSILKTLNALASDLDLTVLLFKLEIEIKRFFSIKEFKKCHL